MADLMKSEHLEQVLFREQSSAVDQLFEQKSEQLFETAANGSFVEICTQEPRRTNPKYNLKSNSQHAKNKSDLSDIEFSCQGIVPLQIPSPMESEDNSRQKRPTKSSTIHQRERYPYIVSNSWKLDRVAAHSQDGFRICSIRQR